MQKPESKSSSVAQLDTGDLKRVLKVGDLFAIGYGDLGSSLYYALGITALYALGATPIALGLAGLVFVCTALTYAEMTSTFHESAGSAGYARHAFNDLISFIAGWGLLLDYIVTIAISSFAIGPYLAYFFEPLKMPWVQVGFAIGVIAMLCFMNIMGAKQSTRLSFWLTGFSLLTQAVIILIGAIFLFNLPTILHDLKINAPGILTSPTWPQFWKGTAMAMVAYTGIDSIAQLGSESKVPSKTVPRAVILTMIILIFMYLGITFVALSAVTPMQLSTEYLENPIVGIVDHFPFGSQILGPWVGILVAVLMFVASNAGLMGASRLSFNMGKYYQLPRFFYALHPTLKTPHVSLIFFAILASLVVVASGGKLTFLGDLYNFGSMIAFFFAHLSLIVLRIKKPDLKRPFRIALNIPFGKHRIPITAIFGCLATFTVWCLIVVAKPEGRNLGLLWMAVGMLTFFLYRRKAKISLMGHVAIEKIKVPGFKPLSIKKILVPVGDKAHSETIQMAVELAKLHGATLTCLHVLQIPYSMPMDFPIPQRLYVAQKSIKKAEAIAREKGVSLEVELIRSRSTLQAILDYLKNQNFDLCIISSGKEKPPGGNLVDKLLHESSCRVWVCNHK